MKNDIQEDYAGGTIFDVNRNAPQFAIACALQELERQLGSYNRASTQLHQTSLLDEIERLRRFALVKGSLAKALAATKRHDNRTIGRQLSDALHSMIGDVTDFVKRHGSAGAPVMERASFRIIACLNFLGSLDAEFL